MTRTELHGWNLTPSQAITLQRELAGAIVTTGEVSHVRFIGGADISVPRGSRTARTAIVILGYPGLELIEVKSLVSELNFPYIPGLLSFREVPPILELFAKLHNKPDLLVVDGQGIAHPRRLGIASHLGLWLDIPTIGCAKSRLCGTHDEIGTEAGSRTGLKDGEEVIGEVFRSRAGSKPLYISSGHKISLENSVQWIISSTRGYRLPETSRLAHLAAGGNLRSPEYILDVLESAVP